MNTQMTFFLGPGMYINKQMHLPGTSGNSFLTQVGYWENRLAQRKDNKTTASAGLLKGVDSRLHGCCKSWDISRVSWHSSPGKAKLKNYLAALEVHPEATKQYKITKKNSSCCTKMYVDHIFLVGSFPRMC